MLHRASSRESCKMQTRKHLFWITSGKKTIGKKAKRTHHRWTKDEKEEVRKMFGEGEKTREIAKRFGVSQRATRRIIKRLSLRPARIKHTRKATRRKRTSTRVREIDICPLCLQPCRILIIKE